MDLLAFYAVHVVASTAFGLVVPANRVVAVIAVSPADVAHVFRGAAFARAAFPAPRAFFVALLALCPVAIRAFSACLSCVFVALVALHAVRVEIWYKGMDVNQYSMPRMICCNFRSKVSRTLRICWCALCILDCCIHYKIFHNRNTCLQAGAACICGIGSSTRQSFPCHNQRSPPLHNRCIPCKSVRLFYRKICTSRRQWGDMV